MHAGHGVTVEEPAHIAALVAAKRQAAATTRRDRVQQAVPRVAELFDRLAVRGEPLAGHAARLLHLLDEYGAAERAAAMDPALARDAPGAGSVAHGLEQRRRARRRPPPVPVVLPADPRVRDLTIAAHPLEAYDALSDPGESDPRG